MARATAASCVLALVGAQSGLYTTCKYSSLGANFDLSMMQLSVGQYAVQDEHDATAQFFFNFCADVPTPMTPDSACFTGRNNRPTNISGALAWQVDAPQFGAGQNYNCYMAGGPAALGWNFSLIDPIRPHRGVRITYPTGENTWCNGQRNRSFTAELQCAPIAAQSAYGDANVFETDANCNYRMQLPSIAGCPTQCITNNGLNGQPAQICNGRGICGYDSDNSYTKCFCYNGWGGSGCTSAAGASSAVTVEGGLLIAVGIILTGVLGLTAYMFVRLRKLQIDPAAYSELEGRFNELGMVA